MGLSAGPAAGQSQSSVVSSGQSEDASGGSSSLQQSVSSDAPPASASSVGSQSAAAGRGRGRSARGGAGRGQGMAKRGVGGVQSDLGVPTEPQDVSASSGDLAVAHPKEKAKGPFNLDALEQVRYLYSLSRHTR